MLLEWTPELSVGLEAVDRQHQELIRRTVRLVEATLNGQGKEEVTRMLDFLKAYVVEHFRSEEDLMEDRGYPNLEKHRGVHRLFEAEVRKLSRRLQEGEPDEAFILTVQNNVVDWLIHHIRGMDKKIGDWVRSQEGVPEEETAPV